MLMENVILFTAEYFIIVISKALKKLRCNEVKVGHCKINNVRDFNSIRENLRESETTLECQSATFDKCHTVHLYSVVTYRHNISFCPCLWSGVIVWPFFSISREENSFGRIDWMKGIGNDEIYPMASSGTIRLCVICV